MAVSLTLKQVQTCLPRAPVVTAARGKQVCTCFNVSETAIVEVLKRCGGDASGNDDVNARLAQLQSELKCGTNCGSCLPALRKLAQTTR